MYIFWEVDASMRFPRPSASERAPATSLSRARMGRRPCDINPPNSKSIPLGQADFGRSHHGNIRAWRAICRGGMPACKKSRIASWQFLCFITIWPGTNEYPRAEKRYYICNIHRRFIPNMRNLQGIAGAIAAAKPRTASSIRTFLPRNGTRLRRLYAGCPR